ncbi:MAG: TIGR04255 family protein [Alphaproteobacteria bacterium]|nr:TIGR04255 family protein [Alphaproteobacteria bacterium]
MTAETVRLKSPPIVEAVVDIDCDLPPSLDLAALEPVATDRLKDGYPLARKQYLQQMQFEAKGEEPPKFSTKQGLQGLQFFSADEKQLVQIRAQGYSLNRLAPYSGFDDYLPEIERTWRIFVDLTKPVVVRQLRLRYINRILLPLVDGRVELDDYLNGIPSLPDESNLGFSGFFIQQSAFELGTDNHVNISIATQPPADQVLPVILDIDAYYACSLDSGAWGAIAERLISLRGLKNSVFRHSLTEKCLSLFQH